MLLIKEMALILRIYVKQRWGISSELKVKDDSRLVAYRGAVSFLIGLSAIHQGKSMQPEADHTCCHLVTRRPRRLSIKPLIMTLELH